MQPITLSNGETFFFDVELWPRVVKLLEDLCKKNRSNAPEDVETELREVWSMSSTATMGQSQREMQSTSSFLNRISVLLWGIFRTCSLDCPLLEKELLCLVSCIDSEIECANNSDTEQDSTTTKSNLAILVEALQLWSDDDDSDGDIGRV